MGCGLCLGTEGFLRDVHFGDINAIDAVVGEGWLMRGICYLFMRNEKDKRRKHNYIEHINQSLIK